MTSNNTNARRLRRFAMGALAVASFAAFGQTLPAPPVSPVPVTNLEYDAQGNLTRVIQGPGVAGFDFKTTNTYDPLSRIKDTTDPKLGKTAFGYDGLDRPTSITDPRALVTQYPRNGLGDTTQLISPDTGTATHTFDAAGNLKTRTDSRGVLATYTYDVLNRLTQVVYSQSGQTSLTYAWGFDMTGTGYAYGIGRLGRTDHPNGSSRYLYDPQGRLVEYVQNVAAKSGANSLAVLSTTKYGYDVSGHLTSITYPSGRKVTYTYAAGQITAVGLAKDASTVAVPLISQVEWEPFGGTRSWQWQMASGTQSHERVHDTYGRVVRYRMGDLVRDVKYDAADRITSYTHYLASTAVAQPVLDQNFTYDELGRIIGVTTGTASWAISYDANGNRTGVQLNGNQSTYTTATSSNRLLSTTNPARTFGYDNAGNTTSDTSGYTSTYNLANRLTTLTKAGITSTYSYDAHGQRIRKYNSTGAASTVIFVYDQNGQLLGEYNSAGAAIREYVWLGSTPIAIFTPDAVAANPPVAYYIHTDHLDTPRYVFNKAGQRRWRWIAEPFGVTAPETNPDGLGVFTQNLRFPGQFADQESGLNYNYFRDYDATTGRYSQSDPIGLAGGINTYAYVEGNPLRYIDPYGLESFLIFTTEGAPSDGRSPWATPAQYARSKIKESCSCKDGDIKTYDVNSVAQINAALSNNSDIGRVVIIGHSGVRGVYVGNSAAPGTNISTLPGANNVSPAGMNWSNLNKNAQIELWGCNAGVGSPSIAQSIADASRRPVGGFDRVINFDDDGRPFVRWWRGGGYSTFNPR